MLEVFVIILAATVYIYGAFICYLLANMWIHFNNEHEYSFKIPLWVAYLLSAVWPLTALVFAYYLAISWAASKLDRFVK